MHTILVALTLLSAPPQFEVQPLDGQKVVGGLVSMDGKQIVLETPAGRLPLELEKVASLAPKQKPAPPKQEARVWVELVDGSSLMAEEYTVQGVTARVKLLGGEVLDVPTRDVATVRLQAGADAVAAEWARIVAMKLHSDVLVTAKGDSIDYHKGVLHDVTDKQVQFDLDGEVLAVKRPKIFGLIYYHAKESEHAEALYTITDASGSRWSARTVTLAEKLDWKTPTGLAVQRPLDQVAQIDLSRGKIVYLSDLKPESATYTPYFGMEKELPARLQFFRPRQDQGLDSKPLKLAGKTYTKGLAMHSRTEMVYLLPGKFSKLEALAGIDDEFRPRGNVRLVLRGDDKVLLEATLTGADAPKPIDVDLAGVKRLTVLVDFGEEMDVSDHLDLCNARIIK
jgi:hypothetical protein